VFWRSDWKAQIIQISWWVVSTVLFFHDVEQYLKSKNLIFIVLCIHYNAPGHVQALGMHLSANEVSVNVHHIPLIQLLDEGINETCKSFYTHCTFYCILDASD